MYEREFNMYKYNFIKIECKLNGWGLMSGNVYNIEECQKIINDKAKDGWRYLGFIPTKQRGTGYIQELDSIFEKEDK